MRGTVNDKTRKPKKSAAQGEPAVKVVAQNRRARHEYDVLDTLECGIMLAGSEVKSLRAGHVSLDEAYAKVRSGEVWLLGCDIPEYSHATSFNHDPKRPRKLLMHRREVKKFAAQAYEQRTDAGAAEAVLQRRGPGQGAAGPVPRPQAARQARRVEESRLAAGHRSRAAAREMTG